MKLNVFHLDAEVKITETVQYFEVHRTGLDVVKSWKSNTPNAVSGLRSGRSDGLFHGSGSS